MSIYSYAYTNILLEITVCVMRVYMCETVSVVYVLCTVVQIIV